MARSWPWRCRYCGCTLDETTATLEHVVPRANGGTSRLSNLALACATCNVLKGSAHEHFMRGERWAKALVKQAADHARAEKRRARAAKGT